MVMEYCDAGTLKQLLVIEMSEGQIANVVKQVSSLFPPFRNQSFLNVKHRTIELLTCHLSSLNRYWKGLATCIVWIVFIGISRARIFYWIWMGKWKLVRAMMEMNLSIFLSIYYLSIFLCIRLSIIHIDSNNLQSVCLPSPSSRIVSGSRPLYRRNWRIIGNGWF